MEPASIVIVGAGPTGTCVAERLCANARHRLDLHVVDPYEPGAGRVWRSGQPELLRTNTPADTVTLYTDASVRCRGPIRPGPTLGEWLGGEGGFVPRAVQGEYLAHAFRHVVRTAGPAVQVHHHRAQAIDLRDGPGGRQHVELSGGRRLEADAVLLTQGHTPVVPEDDAPHHLQAGYADDLPLDLIEPGEPVIVRGLGLTFFDVVTLLTSGRGGRFDAGPDGRLVYLPSGHEPALFAGSRRGVPHHAQFGYSWEGVRVPPPPHSSAVKDLALAYYHGLFDSGRLRMAWELFESRVVELAWGSREMAALIEDAVPSPADRLDVDRLIAPLAGVGGWHPGELRTWMISRLRSDLARRADAAHRADMVLAYGLTAVAHARPHLRGLLAAFANGPPPARIEELCALAEAGVVTFMGAGLTVTGGDPWLASSGTLRHPVEARVLIEARQPRACLSRTADPLLRRLLARGECAEEGGLLSVRLPDRRLHDRTLAVHPARFAFGPGVVGGAATGRLARPRVDSPLLRQADALARTLLRI
ncbi:FAD/NAD(P)-binding protein [Nonomuraea typhae]|uniref:FAD/NAD(P)-binding protein n=1 Tax=Nonomuraea typhae TaxID=2603600 RepID=UPI0012F77A40|nr:FAD/NAD(P)-binding protein [Nonomuraea typhae]